MVGWHHCLSGHEFEQTLGRRGGTEAPGMLPSVGFQRVVQNRETATTSDI